MKKLLYIILPIMMLLLVSSCGNIDLIRTKLSYKEEMIEVSLGEEINVTPNCNKDDVEIVYTLSSDIARIDDEGNLSTLQEGTVIVTASVKNKFSAIAKLVVVIKQEQYQVSFNDDLYNEQITFKKDELIILPTLTKEGYRFLGWYEDGVLVSTITNKNYNLTAMWEKINAFNINYNLMGGIWLDENQPTTFEEDEKVVLPKPVKDGYIFLGWYENDIEIQYLENKDYNLVAKWYEKGNNLSFYTITYYVGEGTLPATTITSFENGQDVVLPTPTRKGYKFLGWYENNNLVTALTNKNYSLVAKWEELTKYTIKYDLDGGNLDVLPTTYTVQDIIVLGTPTKDGHTFVGWIGTDLNKPVLNLVIKNSEKNLEYKAVYEIATYQITLHSNSTNKNTTLDVKYGSAIKLNNPDSFSKKGMMLVGWNTEKDGSGTFYKLNYELIYDKTTDLELFAVWTSLINLDVGENAKVNSEIPVITKGEKFSLPIPTSTDFVFFDGWYVGVEKITDELGNGLATWKYDEEITVTAKWQEEKTINGIKYYYLGEYPQSRVTDQKIIALLNKEVPDYRNYCELNGEYYAKVTYNKNNTIYFNDGTKLAKGDTYYFKIEKILWRVVDEKNNILVSEYVLDALPFYDSTIERKKYDPRLDINIRIYPNDFSESNIEKFLNDGIINRYDLESTLPRINYENEGFKGQAFGGSKKITEYVEYKLQIDNSEASTLVDGNFYSVIDTSGYFFPLSHKEYKNTYADKLKGGIAYASDYAIARGVECQKTGNATPKAASYWLRSPYYKSSQEALYVTITGSVSNTVVDNETIGLRPACKKIK